MSKQTVAKPATPEELIAELGVLSDEIESAIPWNEEHGYVKPELVQLLRDRGFFDILVAKEFGGLDLGPGPALPIFEEMFAIDASAAWVTLIPNLHNRQLNLLPFDDAADLAADGVPTLAGQAAPTGTAERVEGGYRVSGHWEYGSGIHNADLVLGGAMVTENGVRALGPDGAPIAMLVLMPIADVKLAGNWDVLGLKASGSLDYEVTDLFVPEKMTAVMSAVPQFKWGGSNALLGMAGWLVYSHTVIELGLGRRLLDEMAAHAGIPNRRGRLADSEVFRMKFAEAESSFRAARAWVYEVWSGIQASMDAGEEVSTRQITDARAVLLFANRSNKANADWAFDEAGGKSLRAGAINRWFRDIRAAGQHNQVSRKFYGDIARDYLGEADGMVWSPQQLVKKEHA